MEAILSDRSDPEYPIWRAYQSDNDLREVGSVATIIMDLKAHKLNVRKGNITYPPKESGKNTGHEMKDSPANNFVIPFEN